MRIVSAFTVQIQGDIIPTAIQEEIRKEREEAQVEVEAEVEKVVKKKWKMKGEVERGRGEEGVGMEKRIMRRRM